MSHPRYFLLYGAGKNCAQLAGHRDLPIHKNMVIPNHSSRRWKDFWTMIDGRLIIKDTIYQQMLEAGIKVGPAEMIKFQSGWIRSKDPESKYWHILPPRMLQLDPEKSDPRRGANFDERRLVPRADQSLELDLFRLDGDESNGTYCTYELTDLAWKKKWRDIVFQAMDLPGKFYWFVGRESVIRAKDWPPQWYPDDYLPSPENQIIE